MYTTGDEAAWQAQLGRYMEVTEQLIVNPSLTGPSSASQDDSVELHERILYIGTDRIPVVTLCGLLASRRQGHKGPKGFEVLRDVLDRLNLDRLAGFSLRCRVHRHLIQPRQLEIVDNLIARADRVLQQGADYLLLFNLDNLDKHDPAMRQDDSRAAENIYTLYETPLQLFQNLNMLYEHRRYEDPPLQDIGLFFSQKSVHTIADREDTEQTLGHDEASSGGLPVDPDDEPMLQLWEWLSDGERSFLSRMALFALFRRDGVLILLDEPEVHFNDVWKRDIVAALHQMMRDQGSHALITTHSSITLTDVPKEHILVMERDGMYTGDRAGQSPEFATLGADPSDIIVHVFQTPYPGGERGFEYIRDRLARAPRKELENLRNKVAPGYWRYRIQLELARLN